MSEKTYSEMDIKERIEYSIRENLHSAERIDDLLRRSLVMLKGADDHMMNGIWPEGLTELIAELEQAVGE